MEMVKLLITVGNADVNALDLESRSPLHSCGESLGLNIKFDHLTNICFSLARKS